MKAIVFLSCVAVMALAVPTYRPTPHGKMRTECVHEVESGSELRRDEETSTLHVYDHEGKWVRELPLCDLSDGFPLYQPKPTHKAAAKRDVKWQLPASYDGWTAYTAYKTVGTFDAYLGNFSVPNRPVNVPEMFFLFTGLQNENWIPKVDPEPNTGFDIIQPVLQYPGDYGNYFSIKSWYVTTDIGTVYSSEVPVSKGDVIFGNMTRTGKQSWYIGSTSVLTGYSTSLNVKHTRLTNQPWAYNTLEMYGAQDCTTYPTIPVTFSGLQLVTKGKTIPANKVNWLVNPKNSKKKFCKELPIVKSDGTVVFKFQ